MLSILVPTLIAAAVLVLAGTFVANAVLLRKGMHSLSRPRGSQVVHPATAVVRDGCGAGRPRQLPAGLDRSVAGVVRRAPGDGPGGEALILLFPYPLAPEEVARPDGEWDR